MFMYILFIYKKPIILSLFKIDTLNFTMYTLTILTSPLKIYVIGLHNLISMNIFFTIKVFLYNCKKTAENDQVYSNTQLPTQVNTNQHESTRINTSQHESIRAQHDSTRARHESTRINISPTRINTNQHESTRVS